MGIKLVDILSCERLDGHIDCWRGSPFVVLLLRISSASKSRLSPYLSGKNATTAISREFGELRQLHPDALIRLKLNSEIDAAFYQVLCIFECNFDAEAILYFNQVYWPRRDGPTQSLCEGAAK